jgi:hypothetical protein
MSENGIIIAALHEGHRQRDPDDWGENNKQEGCRNTPQASDAHRTAIEEGKTGKPHKH